MATGVAKRSCPRVRRPGVMSAGEDEAAVADFEEWLGLGRGALRRLRRRSGAREGQRASDVTADLHNDRDELSPCRGREVPVVRDMDVVRSILLEVESLDPGEAGNSLSSLPGLDEFTFAGHVELLKEAGFVEAAVARASGVGAVAARADRLTWQGHDFLDAIRSDTVWSKTKSTIAATVGSASLEVVKAVAVSIAMRAALGA